MGGACSPFSQVLDLVVIIIVYVAAVVVVDLILEFHHWVFIDLTTGSILASQLSASQRDLMCRK